MNKMYRLSYTAGSLLYPIREKNSYKLKQESRLMQQTI
jgi:hypothetical protein